MEKYIRVKENGNIDVVEVSTDRWLDDVYKAINCNCIQIVRTTPHHGGMVLVIDDNGKLKKHKVNAIASILYGQDIRDYIAGDVLIGWQGLRNGEPDIVELPDGLHVHMWKYLHDLKEYLKQDLGNELFKW